MCIATFEGRTCSTRKIPAVFAVAMANASLTVLNISSNGIGEFVQTDVSWRYFKATDVKLHEAESRQAR